jgi:hypothetical protein
MGTSQSTIARLESGQTLPSTKTLCATPRRPGAKSVCSSRRLDAAGADARREQRAYIGAGIGSLILITVLGVGWKNGWNFCAPTILMAWYWPMFQNRSELSQCYQARKLHRWRLRYEIGQNRDHAPRRYLGGAGKSSIILDGSQF